MARRIGCRGTYRVGGPGKPVQIRRGPATVTGEARRTRVSAQATGTPSVPGRRGRVGPGARRPAAGLKARNALAERGGSHAVSVLSFGPDGPPCIARACGARPRSAGGAGDGAPP